MVRSKLPKTFALDVFQFPATLHLALIFWGPRSVMISHLDSLAAHNELRHADIGGKHFGHLTND